MRETCYKILVRTSDSGFIERLKNNLPPEKFDLIYSIGESSSSQSIHLFDLIVEESPDILIFELGLNEDAPDVVISAIKKLRPNLKIIALSKSPSPKDADVVEQGVFYYMAIPEEEELVQVIQSAVKVLERSRKEGYCMS